ncbi:hypothetical protein MMC30_003524 [Trapelia coarctata]|nr:hypothetical protein [Trapelia coarctata]
MADSQSKDAAAKQRIIQHMNKDHQDSLVRYLEHFCHISSYYARNARLEDITFNSMTISTSKTSHHVVKINPSLESWSEARIRTVAMDAEAVQGLNRSKVTVKKYTRPNGLFIVVPITVACTFAAFFLRSNFQPGSYLYDYLLEPFPLFARFCYTIQPLLLPLIVAIHSAEATFMASMRLEKHSVPLFSLLWWQWIVNCFFEGYGSFVRFDGIVKEEEQLKAKAKH